MISLASTAKVVKELVIPAQMQFAIPDLTFVLILCAAHLEALPLAWEQQNHLWEDSLSPATELEFS